MDKKQGKGILSNNHDDTVYEGQWMDNKFHGSGCLYWSSNKFYLGEFRNGMLDGIGKFVHDLIVYTGKVVY